MSETAEQCAEEKLARLTDREHVRMRAGMYIGNVDIAGLHHLAGELINNSVDEVLAGHATQIIVTIHRDGSLSVEDDGRGIPVDRHEEESAQQDREVSALEVVMTRLSMGVKHSRIAKTSSGQFGVGLKAVNFLSKSCTATIWRAGSEYQLSFEKGLLVGDLQRIGGTKNHGTRITFRPDPEIFSTVDFDFVRLQARLRELAFLHPNLVARIHDERTQEFQFARGISQLVDELAASQLSCSEVFRLEAEGGGAQIEIAFEFTLYYGQQVRLYVNDQLAPHGGTPVIGLIAGVTRAMRDDAKANRLDVPAALCTEFPKRMAAVIAIRHPEPQWAGCCRHELTNPELEDLVETAICSYLQKRLADKEVSQQFWKFAAAAAERRAATEGEELMSD